MNCLTCGATAGVSDAFCGGCGSALLTKPLLAELVSLPDRPPAPWRGGEVALGILIIAIAIAPVVFLTAEAGHLFGKHAAAGRIWASSHLMGLVILGVVWQLSLKHIPGGPERDLTGGGAGFLSLVGLSRPSTSLRWSVTLTLVTLGASLAATGIYSALMMWLDAGILVPPEIPRDLAFPGAASAFTFEALAVWTPITEEIFFRGFIFAGLVPRLGIWWAMAASASIFSIFHMDPGVLIPIFITGMLLAWLYRRTGSLWPGIAAHGGQNVLALLVAIFVI